MAVLKERQSWMATLAKAEPKLLQELMVKLGEIPVYSYLRSPEIGLAMVRGRAGGTGEQFNLGEITMTRCVIQLGEEGISGFGYVGGRSPQHAELAAVCDALLQHPDWYEQIHQGVIQPLRERSHQREEQTQQQTAATKVNFFTLLRGEG